MKVDTHRITRIVPPVWLLLAMCLMLALNLLFPLGRPVEGLRAFIATLGQLLILGGFTLIFYTARLFRKAATPLKPFVPVKRLITHGTFRYSRNPVYLGMFILLAGWALYLGGLSTWLVVAGFVWMIRRFWVLPEEWQMEKTFGAEYLAYKQRVRRWL